MKNLLFILLISITLLTNLFAQNPYRTGNQNNLNSTGKISGSLYDAQTNQIIEYGNIVLFQTKDSAMVTGTISDKQGKFELANIKFGMYYLKFSYIGYTVKFIDSIRVNPKTLSVDLGKIFLDEQSIELGNVLVTGQKEMIINNLDKKIINVEKDLTTTGGTAVDVVGNIPSVTVDVDGNVSYRGNQNVTILVDGKPSVLVGATNADILNSIPASQIESIELVTNPSARYEPDGTSGILNIILKKRIDSGLNGAVSLNVGTRDKYNGSINLNYRTPYFNIFTSYDTRIARNENEGNSLRTNDINNALSYLNTENNGFFKFGSHNVNLGMDYLYDDFNTFTIAYRYRRFSFDSDGIVITSNKDSAQSLISMFDRSSVADRNMTGINYTFSYRKTFETKGAELTADVIYSDHKMDRDELIVQNIIDPVIISIPSKENGLSSNSNYEWTIQSNYINPIEGFGRIETGFKINLKDLNSKNDYLDFIDSSSIWIEDITRKTNFDYKQQVYAVYGIFSNTINKFQYQIGLRLEQAYVDGNESLSKSVFNKDYFALYPTVHLVQVLPYDQEVQLSYSRRVDRPNNRQLNPYVDKTDSLNIQYGNPELNPEFINSLEFGYSRLFGKTALTSSLFYKQTSDAIANYTILRDDGVTETTFRNLAKNSSYGVELTAAHPLFEWFRLNGSFSYFNTAFEAPDFSTNDNSWMSKLSTVIFVAKDFNLQFNANYNSPIITAQGKIKEMFSADFAAKKDFMDGRLSVLFRVSDIFNTRDMESETYGTNFFTSSYRKMESRVAFLGISYRLSSGKNTKERERQRTEENGMDEF
jgi:outer membrane receptor protein involved in Fe transport